MIVFDFKTLGTEESVNGLKELLDRELPEDVSLLVNSMHVGKSTPLHNYSVLDAMTLININTNMQTYMTMLMLPRLMGRKNRAGIVNLSCLQGWLPYSMTPLEAATHSFNQNLSVTLREGYSDQIDIMQAYLDRKTAFGWVTSLKVHTKWV